MTPKRHVVPVFVPHLGCQNSCVFCNQRRITGLGEPATPETVLKTLKEAAGVLPEEARIQLAFYGGSFTAIPEARQEALLAAASPFLRQYKNASIRISTRPDCIDAPILERLVHYGVQTVELGAQSMCDDVLSASGRGHTAAHTAVAARLIKERGLELVLQMMTGLPEDTPMKSVYTAEKLIELWPQAVRIYPTVVLRGTALYDMWLRGAYNPPDVEDSVSLCAELYERFEKAEIPVIRLGLNPTKALSDGEAVCGAYHPAFGELVYSRVYLNRAAALLKGLGKIQKLTLGVSPGRVSVMTGHKRSNIEALRRQYGIASIRVAETDVKQGEIVIMRIENDSC